jgi:hypothetical protein
MEADEFQRSRDPIGGGHGTDAGPWLDTQIRNFGLSLRGAGVYTAVADAEHRWHARDEFVYWFDEPESE